MYVRIQLSSGLSFGHFHENSRRKKLKLKNKTNKTQEFSQKKLKITANFYYFNAQIFL